MNKIYSINNIDDTDNYCKFVIIISILHVLVIKLFYKHCNYKYLLFLYQPPYISGKLRNNYYYYNIHFFMFFFH